MNMVQIRRIMEMRKELKAPPLLPPKLKKSSFEPMDKTPRDIVVFHFQLRNSNISFSEPVVLSIQESESGGSEGPWKQTAFSDQFFLYTNQFNDLPSVFSIEFEFEIVQPIKIELCMRKEEQLSAVAACIFTVARVINHRRLTIPLLDTRDEQIAILDISCSVKAPPPPVQLQLEVRDLSRKLVSDSGMLNVVVHDTHEGKELHRSEGVKTNNRVNWRPFTLVIHHQLEVILITIIHRDEKTKNEIVIGESQTTVNQLEKDSIEGRVYQMMRRNDTKEGRRVNGLLDIRVTPLPIQSFLQIITNGTSLHLSFAVDFSSSSEEEFSQCLSLDADFIIRSIGDCVEDYVNNSISALGFAARIPPMERESQQFCLSLDTNPYCESMEGVVECLRRSMDRVQPSKNAHLSHVIYYVSKLAIHANLRRSKENTQYFILVILTRGVIDDLKEVVQAVIFASKAPISIVFVGMGDRNKDELDRLGRGGTRIAYQGRRATRDIVHFVDVNSIPRRGVDASEDRNSFSEEALSRVPSQLTAFISKMTTVRTPSRPFGSMTSVESEETEEDERRSRKEHYRIAINGEQCEEGERRSPWDRSSQRSVSCLSRDVRSMSIASEERGFTRMRHEFPF